MLSESEDTDQVEDGGRRTSDCYISMAAHGSLYLSQQPCSASESHFAIAVISRMETFAFPLSSLYMSYPSAPLLRDPSSVSSTDLGEEKRKIALVFSADEAFGMPLAVTLHSALHNLDPAWRAEVYVLDGGLRADTQKRIEGLAARHDATVTFPVPDLARYQTSKLRTQTRFPPINYARIHVGNYLPMRTERALYLDCDMVVEQDLSVLWAKDFGDAVLMAVQDQLIPYVSSSLGVKRWRELGLPPDTPFFNSGMMMINLPRYRRESVGDQVFDYLVRSREQLNLYGNQEGFNAVLATRWAPLDLRWNVIDRSYDPVQRQEIERRDGFHVPASLPQAPHIIHYTDQSKPWESACQHPALDRFLFYLDSSRYYTPTEWMRWRTRHAVGRFLHWVRRRSRSYRHMMGLRRDLFSLSDAE